ncbi:MAG: Stp1/IreP family PP2C-type Ser/Thr phosphatase [Acidobacteria bacterium]|nr:Stp1/IreP family PP2C-type Ser/Thr phosphatase [Acidobacteriota bacterium]
MKLRIVWGNGNRNTDPGEPEPEPEAPGGLRVAALSDPGCHRELNEDCVRVIEPEDAGLRSRKGLMALVADGMGGHQAGEVASALAAEVVSREYYAREGSVPECLEGALQAANREIFQQSASRQSLGGMGTTCTALVILGDEAWAGHVGDSRVYLVRGGSIYRMTEDHSAVMDLVKKGILSAEQARRHADRNVLLRAMGQREGLEVEVWKESFPIRPGDRFVLCSDGLHDPVDDAEIQDAVSRLAPEAACAELVRLARERGGYDNITVVVLRAASTRASEGDG